MNAKKKRDTIALVLIEQTNGFCCDEEIKAKQGRANAIRFFWGGWGWGGGVEDHFIAASTVIYYLTGRRFGVFLLCILTPYFLPFPIGSL